MKSHNFRVGQMVDVHERTKPQIKYSGKIHSIHKKKANEYVLHGPFVDYFYVAFDRCVYDKILLRGWNVIHNGAIRILGDVERNVLGEITKLHIQFPHIIDEFEIDVVGIDAILIWREGFVIENPPPEIEETQQIKHRVTI
jgi:hypothetical protein